MKKDSEPKSLDPLDESIDPRNPDDITRRELIKLQYRFNGIRGSWVGCAHSGPNQFIPEAPGLTAHPKSNFRLL